jgi:hypothetical protein
MRKPKRPAKFQTFHVDELANQAKILNDKISALQQVALMQGALGILLMVRDCDEPFSKEAVQVMIEAAQSRIFEYGPKTGATFAVPGYVPGQIVDMEPEDRSEEPLDMVEEDNNEDL